MEISLVVPNRNNLKYFKWSYDSIRKNQGDHEVWICSAVDACTDGTLEWYEDLAKKDPYFKFIVNKGPERLGHTVLYNKIVEDLVETDLAMIWHCDMYLSPEALDKIEGLMFREILSPNIDRGPNMASSKFKCNRTIASLTRIEPPLHPQGPEKILANFGIEPEEFKEKEFLEFIKHTSKKYKGIAPTNGVFAPWCFWVDEFKEIGGHDFLYAPQSKEDDDIWNRFLLNGTTFIQTWEGFVYHMTCRGSRFNPLLTTPGKNSEEWEVHNQKSTRNYIRKWGKFISHAEYGLPIVSHKYSIGFKIKNCHPFLLEHLEPWCSVIKTDLSLVELKSYIKKEQPNTKFNLVQKLFPDFQNIEPEILVEIDGETFGDGDFFNIQHLSEIITASGEIGTFKLGNLKITVNAMNHYENDLIVCKNEPITLED